ncbi:MAG: DUF92 domain-containing protein [Candidatus Heimdallarchaeaceae archaeon]
MVYEFPPKFEMLDFIGLGILFIYVLGTLAIAEILSRKGKVSGNVSRKIVHLSVGNVVILFPFVFSSVWIALIGPVFFIPFTYFTSPASPIKKFKLKGVGEGHKLGTVFYAISLTVLTAIFFRADPTNQFNVILICSFMPLVWGDGMSAVIGSKYGDKNRYTFLGGKKSLLGSWSAAFATFVSVAASSLILKQTFVVSIYIGLLTGLITAVVEAFTPKGLDNLAVPAANTVVLYLLYNFFNEDLGKLNETLSINSVITGFIIGIVVAILGLVFKALTWDGALAGFYFGIIVLGLGSWTWGAMYLSFFFLGSLFTFIGKKRKETVSTQFEKGDTARDSVQAMVNSIVPAILALITVLFPNPITVIAAGGAIAVSLADTLGTEIGSLSKNNPRVAINLFKRVERGTPGAVSLLGLGASILGALTISSIGVGVSFIDNYVVMPDNLWVFVLTVAMGGIIGAYFDSVFASTIQKMNKCVVCGKITEKKIHCNEKTEFYSGIKWMRNDGINLVSIILGSIISVLISLFWII